MFCTEKLKLYTGAKIVTLYDPMPIVEAVCVIGERIHSMGSLEDMERYAALCGEYEKIDLGGGVLYPGFIDTHSHLSMYADTFSQVYCGSRLGTVSRVLDVLREAAGNTPHDRWLVGYAYDDTGIDEKRHLTREDLDAVSTERPILVKHLSVHFCYLNSLAIEKLGYTAETRVAGGTVCLGADGRPNGILEENASYQAIAKLPATSFEETRKNMLRAVRDYNAQGFTTFMDGGIGLSGSYKTDMAAYLSLARGKTLDARGYLQFMPPVLDALEPYGLWGFPSEYLSFGGVKYFTDGSIQGYTGALLEDYHSRPGYRSELVCTPEELGNLVMHYHAAGIQIAVHTNGDAAIEATLQAYERAQRTLPRPDLHHIFVHAQMASDGQLRRMKACHALPTFFVRHIEVWGDGHYDNYLGPSRANRLDPAGSAVRIGLPFALHVDTPVLPVTALDSIHAAVNRISPSGRLMGAEQRISPREAIKAYTVYASLFCMGEHDRGRIEPGRLADFVLLSDDLEAIDPLTINQVKVRMTLCGGRIVYQA